MSLSQPSEIVKQGTVTRDAFLGGKLFIDQRSSGFRAGADSVLLGASVRATAGDLLDLGAGAGVAALTALTWQADLRATLVEADGDMVALAQSNLEINGLAGRGQVVSLDLTERGAARMAAGLKTDHYASVIANPPYYTSGTRADAARTRARQMEPEALDRWVAVAASHAAPQAEIIFVHLAAALPGLLASFTSRFGEVTVLPLSPRAGEDANRVLIRGRKGSRAPFRLLAGRPLHEPDGRGFLPPFEAIFRGAARLDW